MAEAFIALNKQDVIVNKILNNLQTDEQLLLRVLTTLTALDHEPSMVKNSYSFLIFLEVKAKLFVLSVQKYS
jgi:hypothetical protein